MADDVNLENLDNDPDAELEGSQETFSKQQSLSSSSFNNSDPSSKSFEKIRKKTRNISKLMDRRNTFSNVKEGDHVE